MNKYILTVLFLILVKQGFAQFSIELDGSYTYTSNNISTSFNYCVLANTFYVGTKFVPTRVSVYNDNNLFKRSLNPNSFKEQFGVIVGFRRIIQTTNKSIQPFIFIESQYIKSSYKPTFLFETDRTPEGEKIYKEVKETFGPSPTFETYLGAGVKLQLTNKIDFIQSIGTGMHLIWDVDSRIILSNHKVQFSIAPITFKAGISYKFSD